jgi:hypothetical protein
MPTIHQFEMKLYSAAAKAYCCNAVLCQAAHNQNVPLLVCSARTAAHTASQFGTQALYALYLSVEPGTPVLTQL